MSGMSQNRESLVPVTVSGSFNRHLCQIRAAVEMLARHGACVLSPADPSPVERYGSFLFVASDLRRSVKGTQARHFQAIGRSRFVWLECPDGYVGSSAALEIGYAAACGVPVLSACPPENLTLRPYVEASPSPQAALERIRAAGRNPAAPDGPGLLLDPVATLSAAHSEMEQIAADLGSEESSMHEPLEQRADRVRRLLRSPGASGRRGHPSL